MKFLSDILAKAGLTVDGVVTLNNTATGQTPASNDNSTKLATTAWVRTFVQPYSLPIASTSILGGIKVGTGLSIDAGSGILSVTGGGAASIKSTQTFTATAAQTVFTITGGYIVGLIDVFLNGVYLSPNQTTATNGTSITLGDAALAGDIIDVIIASPVFQGATTTTDQLSEGTTNLYFTNARARAAISETVTGLDYNSSTGVLSITTGYGIPTTASQTTWDAAYNDKINSAAVTGTTTKTLTLTQQDGGTVTATWTDDNTDAVTSVFGRTGVVVAVSGDYTTTLVTEGTNLYYTDARARAAISVTGSGSYDSATGIITVTGGVTSVNTLTGAVVLTTTNIAEGTNLYYTQARFDTAFTAKSTTNLTEGTNLYYTSARANADFDTRLATKSTSNLSEGTNLYYTDTRVGTYLTNNSYATQTYVNTAVSNLVDAAPGTLDTLNELAAALGDDPNFATTVATSIGTKEPAITAGTTGQYWRGDKSWQTLPIYTLSGLGGVPTTRTITINGTAQDLSADRTFTINSMVYPGAGIALSTGSSWGTSITDNSANWNTAFGWGNHASGGYLTTASAASTYVSLSGSYANPSWITSLAYSKITGVPAFITSYTEVDTLATVTARGASTSTNSIFTGGLQARKNQTDNNYTTAALWTESHGNTTTGIAFHISGVVGKFLEMRTNGILYWENNQVWTSGTLTNLNQLTNGPGYITSYSETDTLASVTGRGASTSTYSAFNGGLNVGTSKVGFRNAGLTEFIQGEAWATGHYPYNNNDGILFYQRDASDVVHPCFHIGGWNNAGYGGWSNADSMITLVRGDGANTTGSTYASRGLSNSSYYSNIVKTTARTEFKDSQGVHYFTGTISASNFSGSSSGTNTGDQTNISGNAGTATNLYGSGGSYIASSTSGQSYQYAIQLREAGLGGAQGSNMSYAPRLGFHWSAVVASSIAMEASGRIGIFNNPGTAYENFIANVIYANSSFQGNLTGNVTGNVSGTALNITAHTINQSVGTANAPTFAGLTVNTGGAGTWGQFVVNSTSLWGDGGTLYTTIGAGGAAGIMIYNPHVVWNAGNSCAGIRLGRSGGTSAGKYYEIGTGASDNFFIIKESLSSGTPQLNINSSGNATFSGTLSASNLSGTNTGDQTIPTNNNQLTNGSNYITSAATVAGLNTTFLSTGSTNIDSGYSRVLRNENGSGGNINYAPVLHLAASDTMWQIQGDYSSSSDLRWRAGYAGTWYTWRTIIHSGNIGSQSVANANTVDSRSVGTSTNNIPFLSSTRNLVINNPESYSGEVRLGAAWDRAGVYASSTLTMSTSSGNINFVSNDTALGGFRWDSANGTRFIVGLDGNVSTPYTLVDTNKRPVMYARGLYPVLVLDHTDTSNVNHGPTIQFAFNGSDQRQWVIGASGNGSRLDFGMSNTAYGNSNYNPHNGIAGYLGKTVMRITETGVAVGSLGTYPTINSPSRPLHVYGKSYFSDNMIIAPTSEGWAEGLSFTMPSTTTWGGLRWRRERGNNDGNWYIGFTALDSTDDLVFGANNGGSQVDNIIRLTKAGNVSTSGALTVAGTTTLNSAVNINRHIDANTGWGTCGCLSLFLGWSSSKVVIGNGNSGGHDYANGLGSNSVVSTNPFYCYQDITAYSDSRVKENVEVVDNAVEKIKAIRGVTFTRNDVEDKNKRHAGVIAQEVLAVLPEVVSEDLNGHYSVAYGNLNALLIEAIKEQQTQIESQKSEIDVLKDLVQQLINR